MQATRHAITRNKRAGGWAAPPCVATDCQQPARRGGLCSPCHALVLADAADDLGFRPERVRVDRAAGYVHYRSGGLWYAVHRTVMEARLGRPLLAGENIHHINGNRSDNSPSNLELWVVAQPPGQRPEDLVAYARMILERYGDGA